MISYHLDKKYHSQSLIETGIFLTLLNYSNQEKLKISFIMSNFSLPIDLIISSSIFHFICKVSSIKYLPLSVRQSNLSLELS